MNVEVGLSTSMRCKRLVSKSFLKAHLDTDSGRFYSTQDIQPQFIATSMELDSSC